jgi:hypothetical protein
MWATQAQSTEPLVLLAIVLSVFLRLQIMITPFGIFKLFLLVEFTSYLLLVNSYHCMYFQYCIGKNQSELLPFVYHPLFAFHNFVMSGIFELQFKPNLSVNVMYIPSSQYFLYFVSPLDVLFCYYLHTCTGKKMYSWKPTMTIVCKSKFQFNYDY